VEVLYRRNIAWPELEELQLELKARVQADAHKAFLLVSEPTPTFTHGLSGKPSGLLWADPASHGTAVYPAERGGQWTYHGPGQIVVYPIAHLSALGYAKRQVRPYLQDLAASITRFLSKHSVASEVRDCPFGVYTARGKLTSFGISVRDGISSHGLALYLTPQTTGFAGIVPCGKADTALSSLQDEGVSLDWEAAASELTGYIKTGFQAPKT